MSDKCVCDEMLDKTMEGESYSRYRDAIFLSWECPRHGKVAVDNRTVNNNQAPDPIAQYQVNRMISDRSDSEARERKRQRDQPDFRRRC
jgi:hypothetical protein